MGWLKDACIAIAASAAIAAFFSFGMSQSSNFWSWFAFAIACSIGNGLIMTPTDRYFPGAPESTVQTLSGHTIHAPRLSRLKDPAIVTLLVVLFGALARIFLKWHVA